MQSFHTGILNVLPTYFVSDINHSLLLPCLTLSQQILHIDTALLWFCYLSVFQLAQSNLQMEEPHGRTRCPPTAPVSSAPGERRIQPMASQGQMYVGLRLLSVAFQLTLDDVVMWSLCLCSLCCGHSTWLFSIPLSHRGSFFSSSKTEPWRKVFLFFRCYIPFRMTRCCTASVITGHRGRYMMCCGMPECAVTRLYEPNPSAQQMWRPISSC